MKKILVPASTEYEVLLGRGLLDSLGDLLATVAQGSVFVVSDSNVAPLYLGRAVQSLKRAGFCVSSLCIPAGEPSKSVENYVSLINFLAAKKLTRSDTVLALGGGVVGDLAGFAAATYLRGVRLVQVPTSLLAMVDSSVGGKTAVDIPAGKNLLGAFHQPSLVVCDLDLLDTLPEAVFRDGCAEVIKTAILFDPALFSHLREKGMDFDREFVVGSCIEHKRDIVCADEFDTGKRQLLNLGHTVGHAIERCSDYGVSHGCAVAAGTCILARKYAQDAAEILACFAQFGLPTGTDFSAESLANAALSDKKRRGGSLTLVVPHGVGDCTLESISIDALQSIIVEGL